MAVRSLALRRPERIWKPSPQNSVHLAVHQLMEGRLQGIPFSRPCRRLQCDPPALGTKGAALEDIGARRFELELLMLLLLVLGTNGAAEAALANFCERPAAWQVAMFISKLD